MEEAANYRDMRAFILHAVYKPLRVSFKALSAVGMIEHAIWNRLSAVGNRCVFVQYALCAISSQVLDTSTE